MSLIVEISGMIAGMLAEYAASKKWSKPKLFFAAIVVFFALWLAYILLFPSERGLLVGIFIGICLSIFLGLIFIVMMYCQEKYKR